MSKFILSLLCLCALFVTAGFAQPANNDLEARIEFVLAAVAKSDVTFIRNGEPHNGKEAAEHLRAKYEHYKKDIKTTDDFIRLAGTKSMLSGKPYAVKMKDGKEVASDEWLRTLASAYKGP